MTDYTQIAKLIIYFNKFKVIIIKFGGSVIQDTLDNINPLFPEFISFISNSSEKVFLINGGGIFCRFLQNNLKKIGVDDHDTLDEMGIHVNNMFSNFIKFALPKNLTYPKLIKTVKNVKIALKYLDKFNFFVGGSKGVGHSSDFDAVVLGNAFGSKTILKISNVKYVYNKDPKKNSDTYSLSEVSWLEYLNIIGNRFYPGASFPFDPVASRLAKDLGFSVRLTTLEDFLKIKSLNINNYDGTLIQ